MCRWLILIIVYSNQHFYFIIYFVFFLQLSITVEIINYKDICINNPTIASGIPVYKIRNIYNYICEVFDFLDREKVIIDSADIEEFDKDINLSKIELKKITTFLTQTQNT